MTAKTITLSMLKNFSTALANTKYNERKPSIANMFEVYIKNGSVVIENIAGKESIAKIMSETSIKISE